MNVCRVLAHHRPAQDGRLVVPGEHAHRYHLQAVPVRGDDLLVRGHRGRLAGGKSQHHGNARAEDVRVNEPDATAALLEREREIDGDGGLAHAALAAAHRDDVPDAWQLVRTGGRRLGRCVWRVVVVVVRTGGLHASSFLSFWPRDAVVPTSRPRGSLPVIATRVIDQHAGRRFHRHRGSPPGRREVCQSSHSRRRGRTRAPLEPVTQG